MSATASWLRRAGYWVPSGPASASVIITHVFLNGGKMSVPVSERHTGLLAVYASDVVAGRPLYVVERTVSGGSYRMFADLDIHLSPPSGSGCSGGEEGGDGDGDGDGLLERALEHAIAALPPVLDDGEDIVVCTRRLDGGKVGAHLVWSRLRVDDAAATHLRAAWLQSIMALSNGGGWTRDWWEKVLDASVYRRSGLRMPWSLKKGGTAAAAYVPTHVVSRRVITPIQPSCAVDIKDASSVEHWLRRTSLMVCGPDEDGYGADPYGGPAAVMASVAPPPSRSGTGNTNAKTNTKTKTKTTKVVARRTAAKRDETTMNAAPTPVALSSVQAESLRRALPPEYQSCVLGGRCIAPPGGGLLIVSSDSRFCLIAGGRQHSSNHVFFELHSDGRIVQRCHSSKCAGQRHELAVAEASGHCLDDIVPPRMNRGTNGGSGGTNGGSGSKKGGKKRTKRACLLPATASQAAARWIEALQNKKRRCGDGGGGGSTVVDNGGE